MEQDNNSCQDGNPPIGADQLWILMWTRYQPSPIGLCPPLGGWYVTYGAHSYWLLWDRIILGLPVGKERHRDGENCHLSRNHWYRPIGVVVMWQVAEAWGTRIINKQASTTSSPQRSIPPCQISASIISFTKGPTPKGTIISRGPITSGYVYAVEYGSRGTTGHVAGLPLGPDANRGVHVSYLSVACWRGPCPLRLGHSVPAHLPCPPLQLWLVSWAHEFI